MCRDFYYTPEEIYVAVLEQHKPLSAALTDGKEAVKKTRKNTGYIRSVRIPKDLRKAMNN